MHVFISNDNSLELRYSINNSIKKKYEGHTQPINTIQIHGDIIATGSIDHSIQLFKTQSSRYFQKLVGHNGSINTLLFYPSGKYIISGSSDNTIKVWDLESNLTLLTLYHDRDVNGDI